MVVPRGVLPLLVAGSTGLTLVGVGVTGLVGLDPALQRAAADVGRTPTRPHHRPAPRVAPDVPGDVTARQLVDCPEDRTPATHPGKV